MTTNPLNPRYERITYVAAQGARPRRVILRLTTDTRERVAGYQVDVHGDDVSGKGFDRNLHVLGVEDITKRVPLVFDHKYGTLVPDGTATQQEPR